MKWEPGFIYFIYLKVIYTSVTGHILQGACLTCRIFKLLLLLLLLLWSPVEVNSLIFSAVQGQVYNLQIN